MFLQCHRRVRFGRSNHARDRHHLQAALLIERGGPRYRKLHPLADRQLIGGLKENTFAAYVDGLPGLLGDMAPGIEQAIPQLAL